MTADSKGTYKFSPIHISYCAYQALPYRLSWFARCPHQPKIGDYFTACMDGPAVEKLEVTEATASSFVQSLPRIHRTL